MDRLTLFLAALSLLGAASVILREVTYGVLLNADGIIYISVARNLLEGEGFVDWQGHDYVNWAPLWPTLLALFSLPGLDPHDVAGFVNAGAFGLTIFISGSWLRRHIESRFLIVWTCLAIMLPITLVYHAATAFSETVFILFATLSLIAMYEFLNGGRKSLLFWAAALGALAWLTRYSGVTVVFASVLLLALDRNPAPLERAKRAAVYSVVSAAPICLWMLRNLSLMGHPMGPRGSSAAGTLPESTGLTISSVGGWVVFPLYSDRITALADQIRLGTMLVALQDYVAPAMGVVLLILATGAVAYCIIRLSTGGAEGVALQVDRQMSPIVVFGTFALVYLAFLTVVKSLTIVDNHARHYAPAYIPILMVAVFGMDGLLRHWRGRTMQRTIGWLPTVASVALCLWIAYHGVVNAFHAGYLVTEGIGYQSKPWVDSETMRYVETQGLGGDVYSQSRRIMYWHLYGKHWERASGGVAEESRLWNLPLERRILGQWREGLSVADGAGAAHVVWFRELRRRTDYDVEELVALPGLELVSELSDGVILRVKN